MRTSDQQTFTTTEDHLSELLESLSLQQDNLLEELTAIKASIDSIQKQLDSSAGKSSSSSRAHQPINHEFAIGNQVRILNPRKNQPSEGFIAGFTATGFARITLSNGITVRRLQRNLALIE